MCHDGFYCPSGTWPGTGWLRCWGCWETGPSTDRAHQPVVMQPSPKDWQKRAVSWVSVCSWGRHKSYPPTHTLFLMRTEKLSVQWMTVLPSSLTLDLAVSTLHTVPGWHWSVGSSRRDTKDWEKGPTSPLSGSECARSQGRESDLGSLSLSAKIM